MAPGRGRSFLDVVGELAVGSRRRGWLARFVLRRVSWAVAVLLAVVLITFGLAHLAPGNPWTLRGESSADGGASVQLSDAAIGFLNAKYGLDQPWWHQLVTYIGNVAHFDFGVSYQYSDHQVSELVLQSLSTSVLLAGAALLVIVPVGIGFGVRAALRHNSVSDHAVTGFTTVAASVPNFVIGIFLILVLSIGLNRATGGAFYLPAAGFALDQHLILPVATLSLFPIAFLTRLTRSGTLDVLREDHVRTARAKGLGERAVLARHVLKNSLVPIVTTVGPMFGFLATGTVVVESLFQIPGLGGLFVTAIGQRDYPVILAVTILFALVFVAVNLIVDLLYVVIDPRVKPS